MTRQLAIYQERGTYRFRDKAKAFCRGFLRGRPMVEVAMTGLTRSGIPQEKRKAYQAKVIKSGNAKQIQSLINGGNLLDSTESSAYRAETGMVAHETQVALTDRLAREVYCETSLKSQLVFQLVPIISMLAGVGFLLVGNLPLALLTFDGAPVYGGLKSILKARRIDQFRMLSDRLLRSNALTSIDAIRPLTEALSQGTSPRQLPANTDVLASHSVSPDGGVESDMKGGSIAIKGDAGRHVGEGMANGSVIISGNTGDTS